MAWATPNVCHQNCRRRTPSVRLPDPASNPVNRIATIQEHNMILKAIKNGLCEDRIAKALDVDVAPVDGAR